MKICINKGCLRKPHQRGLCSKCFYQDERDKAEIREKRRDKNGFSQLSHDGHFMLKPIHQLSNILTGK